MTILGYNPEQIFPQTHVSMRDLGERVRETKKGVDEALKRMREQEQNLIGKKELIEKIAMMCEESHHIALSRYARFLRKTGNINIRDFNDWTILMNIAHHGHGKEIAELLLTHPDTLINEKNNNGETALMLSMNECNMEIAELLLARPDIQINEKNDFGFTLFTWAVINNRKDAIIRILDHPYLNLKEHEQGEEALAAAKNEEIRALIKAKMREQGIEF